MVTITSTPSLTGGLRQSVLELQTQLSKAQVEVSTGRVDDLSLSLGRRAAHDYSLGISANDLEAISQSNSTVSGRLDSTQTVLTSIADTAQKFLETLAEARSGGQNNTISVVNAATNGLKSLISELNTSVGGVHLFGGINSSVAPIADYFASPAQANKQSVDLAFSTAFGMSQSDPAVNSITAAQMQTFLSGAFSSLFSSSSWSADWSSASSQPLQSRISINQTADTSVSANDPAFQKLAMAYTMVADLGAADLGDDAYQEVLKLATDTMSEAISELIGVQASVGLMQSSVSNANNTISAQKSAIGIQIGSLENVDPYEASTRLSNLTTQIETAYTITGKIQQLTLAKYI